MPRKILLTGVPGVGKTTVIREIARLLGTNAAGFYTEETRRGGRRTGFDIVTLGGRRTSLSRAGKSGRHMVGRYAVDVASLDAVAVPAIGEALESEKVIIIDEIGKMELFSEKFRKMVVTAFDSANAVVAVIMMKANSFADSLKRRPGVTTIEVTHSNRDALPRRIIQELGQSEDLA